MTKAKKLSKASVSIIFTTVAMDLIGFGMIIPLQGLYGKEFGASGFWLGFLGAAYPLAQFIFAPFWGQRSDRMGRRPIILMSLTGSTLSFLGFAIATYYQSFAGIIITRLLQGAFAANISAAQAYIADVTPPAKRAAGMGLIGAAFGIGFLLGPPLGGLSAKYLGIVSPGLIAAGICGLNLWLAWRRLPESLSEKIQKANCKLPPNPYAPLNLARLRSALNHRYLGLLLAMIFLQTIAFGAMEQVFALFLRSGFPQLSMADAAEKTAYLLLYVGLIGAAIQGGLIRKLSPIMGERLLLSIGLLVFGLSIGCIPMGAEWGYASFFAILLPLAIGRSFIDPSASSLVSKAASAQDQGKAFGTFQGLTSLARIIGPYLGLRVFETHPALPFHVAGAICIFVFILSLFLYPRAHKA